MFDSGEITLPSGEREYFIVTVRSMPEETVSLRRCTLHRGFATTPKMELNLDVGRVPSPESVAEAARLPETRWLGLDDGDVVQVHPIRREPDDNSSSLLDGASSQRQTNSPTNGLWLDRS